jgi:Holliday junction resolvase RusA-like endonuclease
MTKEEILAIASGDSFYLDISSYKDRQFKEIDTRLDLLNKNEFYEFNFIFDGEPSPAPRPRSHFMKKKDGSLVTDSSGRPVQRWYDPGSVKKAVIKKYVKSILPEDFEIANGEVYLSFRIFKPPLSSFSMAEAFLAEARFIRPDVRPDIDNYEKTVLDALNGVIWSDDGRVVALSSEKYYSCRPRIEVDICYTLNRLCNK